MKLKNGEIESFSEFLMSFELKGRESRLRTRFVKLLIARFELVQEEHAELIKQFARTDDSGKPKIIEQNNVMMYDVQDRAGFNREYTILLNEDFIIEENEERKDMLLYIKDVILNCEKTFKDREAIQYDRWCEIVEEIEYEN